MENYYLTKWFVFYIGYLLICSYTKQIFLYLINYVLKGTLLILSIILHLYFSICCSVLLFIISDSMSMPIPTLYLSFRFIYPFITSLIITSDLITPLSLMRNVYVKFGISNCFSCDLLLGHFSPKLTVSLKL